MRHQESLKKPYQIGVGGLFNYFSNVARFNIGVYAQNTKYEGGITGMYQNHRDSNSSDSRRFFHLGISGGLRKEMTADFFLTNGFYAETQYYFKKHSAHQNRPYAIGSYTGFEYQPYLFLQWFVNVAPFAYVKTAENDKHTILFGLGQIGIKYFVYD